MTDDPLRGSVNSVGIPYGPPNHLTRLPETRVRLVLFIVWLAMLVPGLVYVTRYPLVNPFVDEWAFVPVLLGDEPAGPWLWELHNEHRFVLPRVVYLGLFRLTGRLGDGCLVSFLGMSLLAAGLVRLARAVRGRSDLADAAFPLLLMHTGQGENLYMGYQMCFMLVAVLAGGLLGMMVHSSGGRPPGLPDVLDRPGGLSPPKGASGFRPALLAALLGLLLLACGAAGLVYGVVATIWVLYLAVRGPMHPWQRLVLVLLVGLTPVYIAVYSQGYRRPGHHPESAGVFESVRIGLEAQAMALGPAATGLWPVIGVGLVLVAGWVVGLLLQMTWQTRGNPRIVGLLLFVLAGGAVAFGIGWGRSGFHNDMGFAWRYGWITVPPVAAAYFTWLLRGGRVAQYAPRLLALALLVIAPVNTVSGFLDAETRVRPAEAAIEADVRAGRTADEVVERNFPDYPPALRRDMAGAMRRMRDHGYAYYQSLGREAP